MGFSFFFSSLYVGWSSGSVGRLMMGEESRAGAISAIYALWGHAGTPDAKDGRKNSKNSPDLDETYEVRAGRRWCERRVKGWINLERQARQHDHESQTSCE